MKIRPMSGSPASQHGEPRWLLQEGQCRFQFAGVHGMGKLRLHSWKLYIGLVHTRIKVSVALRQRWGQTPANISGLLWRREWLTMKTRTLGAADLQHENLLDLFTAGGVGSVSGSQTKQPTGETRLQHVADRISLKVVWLHDYNKPAS